MSDIISEVINAARSRTVEEWIAALPAYKGGPVNLDAIGEHLFGVTAELGFGVFRSTFNGRVIEDKDFPALFEAIQSAVRDDDKIREGICAAVEAIIKDSGKSALVAMAETDEEDVRSLAASPMVVYDHLGNGQERELDFALKEILAAVQDRWPSMSQPVSEIRVVRAPITGYLGRLAYEVLEPVAVIPLSEYNAKQQAVGAKDAEREALTAILEREMRADATFAPAHLTNSLDFGGGRDWLIERHGRPIEFDHDLEDIFKEAVRRACVGGSHLVAYGEVRDHDPVFPDELRTVQHIVGAVPGRNGGGVDTQEGIRQLKAMAVRQIDGLFGNWGMLQTDIKVVQMPGAIPPNYTSYSQLWSGVHAGTISKAELEPQPSDLWKAYPFSRMPYEEHRHAERSFEAAKSDLPGISFREYVEHHHGLWRLQNGRQDSDDAPAPRAAGLTM